MKSAAKRTTTAQAFNEPIAANTYHQRDMYRAIKPSEDFRKVRPGDQYFQTLRSALRTGLYIIEPGDFTRYAIEVRTLGVYESDALGFGLQHIFSVTVYDGDGTGACVALTPVTHRSLIECWDFRKHIHSPSTRRVALALVNYCAAVSDEDNVYLRPFTGDEATDGYSV